MHRDTNLKAVRVHVVLLVQMRVRFLVLDVLGVLQVRGQAVLPQYR